MATIEQAAATRSYTALPRRGPITRLLEDERWLAGMLLLPTIVLLGLFIAYPFVKGVLLAVTDTKVGVPGQPELGGGLVRHRRSRSRDSSKCHRRFRAAGTRRTGAL